MTISVTLQCFTWQMEATSYVNFIGWKFDMWIQAWKLIHSLQVMYENYAVSFYREKQSLLTVELKNLTTKQRKKSLQLWCGFLAKYFSTGWETVYKNYRRFHGRGRHLGSGANPAKFTVNVWEKSWLWCSITRGRLIFWNFWELQTKDIS